MGYDTRCSRSCTRYSECRTRKHSTKRSGQGLKKVFPKKKKNTWLVVTVRRRSLGKKKLRKTEKDETQMLFCFVGHDSVRGASIPRSLPVHTRSGGQGADRQRYRDTRMVAVIKSVRGTWQPGYLSPGGISGRDGGNPEIRICITASGCSSRNSQRE